MTIIRSSCASKPRKTAARRRQYRFWSAADGRRNRNPRAPDDLRIDARDAEELRKGLAQLALQIINLLRELIERQVVRRMMSLPPEKQEELGAHLLLLRSKIDETRRYFGIREDEMELGLIHDLDRLVEQVLQPFRQTA